MCEAFDNIGNSAETDANMATLDKIIVQASNQGILEKLIRITASVMRVFLTGCSSRKPGHSRGSLPAPGSLGDAAAPAAANAA